MNNREKTNALTDIADLSAKAVALDAASIADAGGVVVVVMARGDGAVVESVVAATVMDRPGHFSKVEVLERAISVLQGKLDQLQGCAPPAPAAH